MSGIGAEFHAYINVRTPSRLVAGVPCSPLKILSLLLRRCVPLALGCDFAADSVGVQLQQVTSLFERVVKLAIFVEDDGVGKAKAQHDQH